jgi:DNA-binding response OmpR family regulator
MSASRRILVVEDDPGLRDTLAEVLRDDGHDVRVAEDGEAALATIESWVPELIVLDLMMPRMDGFAFRQAQQDRSRTVAPKVLLLSAAHGVEAAAAELRADAWLVKPFGLHDVLDSVEGLLGNGSAPGHS